MARLGERPVNCAAETDCFEAVFSSTLLGPVMSKTLLLVVWNLWMVNIISGSLPDV